MKRIILLVALFLGGCAGTVRPPAIAARVVTSEVVVPIPCANVADLPAEPPHVASLLTGMAGHDLLVVDQSALDLRTWGEVLFGKLTRCAIASPPAPPSGTVPRTP